MEANFDDLCTLTLSEKAEKAAAASPAAKPEVPSPNASRRWSSVGGRPPPPTGKAEIALHVLVLGEEASAGRGKMGAFGRPKSVSSLIRQSFRYAILDEKSTSSTYHKVLVSKPNMLRNGGVRHVSVLLLHSGDDVSNYVSIFNYPAGSAGDFEENRILRHILPPQVCCPHPPHRAAY